MKKQLSQLLLLLPALFFSHLILAAIPPEFQAQYELNKYGMTLAQSDSYFKKNSDGTLVYHSETKLRGLASLFRKDHISEHSELTLHDGKLRTTRYAYTRKDKKKTRRLDLTFDWKNKTASNQISNEQWTIPILDNTTDTFSLQLRMMTDLAAGKKDLTYSIINKGKLKTYHFEILEKEEIEVPSGTFKTVKIKRSRKNSKRVTLMWCAPDFNYLPVKITHIEKSGSKFSLQLTELKGAITNNKKISANNNNDDDQE